MPPVAGKTEVEIIAGANTQSSYVDWGAIIAGAVTATAIVMTLVAFGSAIGLTFANFNNRAAMPGVGVVIAIGVWLLWLQVTASLGGGYLTGRLRRRIHDAPSHETGIRDGMHGLVVWALGVLIGSLLAAWIASIGTIGAAASSSGRGPQGADAATLTSDYYVDRLLRPEMGTDAAAAAQQNTRVPSPEARSEISRLLSAGRLVSGQGEDRDYLVRRLVTETGLPEQAVSQRVDTTIAMMKAEADHVRRLGVMTAFMTVVSLLISAVAAWWAAMKGGDHRDQSVDHSRFFAWR
jgi:hypothetical protein